MKNITKEHTVHFTNSPEMYLWYQLSPSAYFRLYSSIADFSTAPHWPFPIVPACCTINRDGLSWLNYWMHHSSLWLTDSWTDLFKIFMKTLNVNKYISSVGGVTIWGNVVLNANICSECVCLFTWNMEHGRCVAGGRNEMKWNGNRNRKVWIVDTLWEHEYIFGLTQIGLVMKKLTQTLETLLPRKQIVDDDR